MHNLELILFKTYADIRAEAARSYLGLLWWVIEPVLYLFTFYVLFVLILHRGGPDFVPFFLSGMVAWKWFDSSIKGGSQSIRAHSNLIQQVYVPKYIFPIVAVLNSTARFLPLFLILLIFLLVTQVHVTPAWLSLPFIIITQFLLVTALAMLVGAITPYLPDLKIIIDNGMMLLFFLSGVFFDIESVSEPMRSLLFLNPMAILITQYRGTLVKGMWPNFDRLCVVALSSIVIAVLALAILKRLDNKYGKLSL